MAEINFIMPVRTEDLLHATNGQYSVHEVLEKHEIAKSLKAARQCFTDEGPTFILEKFDTYYSVIHIFNQIPRSSSFQVYEDLRKALVALPNHIQFLIDEGGDGEEINGDHRSQMQNVLKMTIWLFVSIVQLLEVEKTDDLMTQRAKKMKPDNVLHCEWELTINVVRNLLQVDLNKFWDNPGVDEMFTSKVSDICSFFLEKPAIKQNKSVQNEIWTIFGLLITNYQADQALIIKLVRLVKEHEHVGGILAEGIKQVVGIFKCGAIVGNLVKELSETQMNSSNVEQSGSKHCSKMLVEMAVNMPTLMLNEISYLNMYLSSDAYQMRNMVLSVQVEVLLANLAKQDAPDEDEILLRNEILHRLERYTCDSSSHVRAKVFAHIARLQSENALTAPLIKSMLQRAVVFLRDVTVNVRKAAANCVTAMLKCNIYGPKLSLNKFKQDLQDKIAELMKLKYDMFGLDMQKQEELEAEWQQHVDGLREVITANNQEEDEISQREEQEDNAEKPSMEDLIRSKIREKQYKEAFIICKTASKNQFFKDLEDKLGELNESDLFICFLHLIFTNSLLNLGNSQQITVEQMTTLSRLDTNVEYLKSICDFLALMEDAVTTMRQLLKSVTIADMHEAVDFLITAYQFKLDGCMLGIIDILKLMMRNEQDRRKFVLEALKTVYLVTDSKNLLEHTTQVVERLIELYHFIAHDTVDSLSTLIAEWSQAGILGNDIFETMWKYVLKTIDVSDKKSRAALVLLRMAARGRQSIVERNYRMIAHLCLKQRGRSDILFAIRGIEFLNILSCQVVDITSDTSQFRIDYVDPIWTDLRELILYFYEEQSAFVNMLLVISTKFIYNLCALPVKFIDKLFVEIGQLMANEKEVEIYKFIRFYILFGETVVGYLTYLDDDVYKELKRRQHIKHEKKNVEKNAQNKSKSNQMGAIARSRKGSANVSLLNASKNNKENDLDESLMEGAEAIDDDADFIANVLEHRSITSEFLLGDMFNYILPICRSPELYQNAQLQNSAITAVLRGMLVSSTFCESLMKLIFTVLHKTKFVPNKVTILLHMSDLLERHPNVVEPYTPKLYGLLEDKDLQVREMDLKMLSLLILKDMIRPQEHIWRLARCIIDSNSLIAEISKAFFIDSSQKSNNLYNYMPDIFSHLVACIPDNEQLQTILTFLFSLVDKTKHVENLVERFCFKFDNVTDDQLAQKIAFCLSLMSYNDKALQKLVEHFPKYKQFILVDQVYAHFKQIIAASLKNNLAKNDLKAVTTQLNELMEQMFEVGENGDRPRPPNVHFKKPPPPKQGKPAKSTGRKARTVKRASRQTSIVSEDDDDDEDEPARPIRSRKRSVLQQ